MCAKVFAPPKRKFANIDMFAGAAAISRAFRAHGYSTATLDIALDKRDEARIVTRQHLSGAQDILSPGGFARHLWAAMHIAKGGIATIGIVCSTWVAINRNVSEFGPPKASFRAPKRHFGGPKKHIYGF